jgi:hypothetical protein
MVNMRDLRLVNNQQTGMLPFSHVTWFGSLPLVLKTSSYALAGSIPTEFGKLINMQELVLYGNKLSGAVCSFWLVW